MKALGGSYYISPQFGATAELLLRFALSQEVSTAIVGCGSAKGGRGNGKSWGAFSAPADEEEMKLLDIFRPHARRLVYYRGTD